MNVLLYQIQMGSNEDSDRDDSAHGIHCDMSYRRAGTGVTEVSVTSVSLAASAFNHFTISTS